MGSRMQVVMHFSVSRWYDVLKVPTLVVTSLILQLALITLGRIRKHADNLYIRFFVWSSYLLANWIAAVALSVLSSHLGDIVDSIKSGQTMAGGSAFAAALDADFMLFALWAPFLLLHLGGPDTITAYSLEDIKLWLRQIFGLFFQTGVVIYVSYLAWRYRGSHNRFSIFLTIPMVVVGIIKYGERVWALKAARKEYLLASIFRHPVPGPNYNRFMEEFTWKQYQGFWVDKNPVTGRELDSHRIAIGKKKARTVVKAYFLFDKFKKLFGDLILSFQDLHDSQALFDEITGPDAFEVVEMELGIMYNKLYTKGAILHSVKGCCLRVFTLVSTLIVWLLFFLVPNELKQKFSKSHLAITHILLITAILVDIVSLYFILGSDWMSFHLCNMADKHPKVKKLLPLLPYLFPKPKRWSRCISQFNLLNFCLSTRMHVFCYNIFTSLGMGIIWEKLHIEEPPVSEELKSFLFNHLHDKFRKLKVKLNSDEMPRRTEDDSGSNHERQRQEQFYKIIEILISTRANLLPTDPQYQVQIRWSLEDVTFDQSVLIWHIATDICYSEDIKNNLDAETKNLLQTSRQLSEYMMYLLVMFPRKLPKWRGTGRVRYQDTRAEASNFFEEHRIVERSGDCFSRLFKWGTQNGIADEESRIGEKSRDCFPKLLNWRTRNGVVDEEHRVEERSRNFFSKLFRWCTQNGVARAKSITVEKLRNVNTVLSPIEVKGNKSKSALFEGCKLASQLLKISSPKQKWEMISYVWAQMLIHAASQCEGTFHSQMLSEGGELITHVWLLMAHFGLMDNFQISHGYARPDLVYK